jgi:hypothetical protein
MCSAPSCPAEDTRKTRVQFDQRTVNHISGGLRRPSNDAAECPSPIDMGLIPVTGYFLNYARTDPDVCGPR